MRRISEEFKRRILDRIKPTPEEEDFLRSKAEEITSTLKEILDRLGYEARVEVLGSFTKGTRIRGKKELDVFILVPPPEGITRKNYIPYFEKLIEELKKTIPWEYEIRYANHPYIRVKLGEVSADVVPGFIVEPTNIISPVDRSPYHAEFVKNKLDDRLRDEVRLLKQFLKGIKAYGAEIKVQGLSGYACELLVISEGSFEKALEAIRRLKFVDPAGHYKFEEPFEEALSKGLRNLIENSVMVIVDPVDPKRNVAAALSRRTYARLRMSIELFFRRPKEEFFFPPEIPERDSGNALIIYGRIGGLSEDIIRGKLRRVTRIIEKRVHEDENLSYYVTEIYPGTSGDWWYVYVGFLDTYSKIGKFRGPKAVSGRLEKFLERFDRIWLKGPIEPKDISKEFIKPPEYIDLSKITLGKARKAIKRSREAIVAEFHLEAIGELRYDDPKLALRSVIKGGLPIEYEGVRPIDGKPLPSDLRIRESEIRLLKYLAKRSDRLGFIILSDWDGLISTKFYTKRGYSSLLRNLNRPLITREDRHVIFAYPAYFVPRWVYRHPRAVLSLIF